MTQLPLRPNLYPYRGANPEKQRRTAELNRLAHKIARHANQMIADDPAEIQTLLFRSIASDLGIDVTIVRHVLDGGHNGLTVRVTAQDREAIAMELQRPT